MRKYNRTKGKSWRKANLKGKVVEAEKTTVKRESNQRGWRGAS